MILLKDRSWIVIECLKRWWLLLFSWSGRLFRAVGSHGRDWQDSWTCSYCYPVSLPPPFLSLPPHCTKWTWDHAWFQMSWPCWIYLDVCELCMSSSHVPSYLCLYAWTSLGVCLRIRVGFVCVLWGFWILCNDKACSLFWDVDREQFLIHVYPGCKLVQWLAGWTVNPEMGRGTGGWRQD